MKLINVNLLILNFILLQTICNTQYARTRVKFTNIKCVAFDKPFADFRHCYLKVIKRGVVALNVHVELYKVPVTNVSGWGGLRKKANGYRPFLYNYTVDYCKFLVARQRSPFISVIFDVVKTKSNINHKCPYDHDIIVNNLVLEEKHFRIIPLPKGEYSLAIQVHAYNDPKAEVTTYFEVTDDL